MRKNCWDFKNCGREPGGSNSKALGICPAALEATLHGIHGGKNSGRTCWIIAGTFCGGSVQGTYASKFGSCEKCDFYNSVKAEEFPNFQYSLVLLEMLRKEEKRQEKQLNKVSIKPRS